MAAAGDRERRLVARRVNGGAGEEGGAEGVVPLSAAALARPPAAGTSPLPFAAGSPSAAVHAAAAAPGGSPRGGALRWAGQAGGLQVPAGAGGLPEGCCAGGAADDGAVVPPDPVVLHADPWLLVVDKPSGLLSQPGLGPDLTDAVVGRLEARWGPLALPHRLDRDTSGLLLLARDAQTLRSLGMALAARRVRRTYLADVAGVPPQASGRIEAPLARARRRPPQHRVHPDGRPSCTDWCLLQAGSDWSRLRLRPRTGRSHQLRVHLAWFGHPILGDPLYGTAASRSRAERLRLHAWRLLLLHPWTGRPLRLEAPLPWSGVPPGSAPAEQLLPGGGVAGAIPLGPGEERAAGGVAGAGARAGRTGAVRGHG